MNNFMIKHKIRRDADNKFVFEGEEIKKASPDFTYIREMSITSSSSGPTSADLVLPKVLRDLRSMDKKEMKAAAPNLNVDKRKRSPEISRREKVQKLNRCTENPKIWNLIMTQVSMIFVFLLQSF